MQGADSALRGARVLSHLLEELLRLRCGMCSSARQEPCRNTIPVTIEVESGLSGLEPPCIFPVIPRKYGHISPINSR